MLNNMLNKPERPERDEHDLMQLYDFVAEGTPITTTTIESCLADQQITSGMLEIIHVVVEPVAELEPQQRRRLNALTRYIMQGEGDTAKKLATWHLHENVTVGIYLTQAEREERDSEKRRSRMAKRKQLADKERRRLESGGLYRRPAVRRPSKRRAPSYSTDTSTQHGLSGRFDWS